MNKLLLFVLIALSAQSCMLAKKHHGKHHDNHHCKTDCRPCGPNRNQAAPCLKSAKKRGCEVVVDASLCSVAETDFLVQVYSDDSSCKKSESVLLGQKTVHTSADGKVCFVATVPCNCACADKHNCNARCVCGKGCKVVKATATRLRGGAPTDTSEFSKRVKVSH